jgi:hypothetical protein
MGDQMKEVWQDMVCDICGRREIYTGLFPGNQKSGDNLEELNLYRRVI